MPNKNAALRGITYLYSKAKEYLGGISMSTSQTASSFHPSGGCAVRSSGPAGHACAVSPRLPHRKHTLHSSRIAIMYHSSPLLFLGRYA